MADALGNTEQVRAIVESAGEAAAAAAIRKFVSEHPHFAPQSQKVETPAYVKWGSGVAATIVAAAIIWMAATLNQLQITVARIDERQTTDTTRADIRDLQDQAMTLENRVSALEREHAKN